jgi:transcriptional regulator with XRE-family HTH domain
MRVNNIGETIKLFRKQKAMSQLDLEMKVDLSQGSLSRIETGEVNPTKETLLKIISALNIRVHDAAEILGLDIEEFLGIANLSKQLTESLNLKTVLFRSVQDICRELNLLGAAIFLVKDNHAYIQTATQSRFTQLFLKVAKVGLEDIYFSLTSDTENFVVKAINTQNYYVSNQIIDFAKPIISPRICKLIETVVTVKSCLALPIVCRNSPIGAMVFAKSYKHDFKNELPVLKIFTEHIAVAIHNAQKYEELQDEIKTLKEKLKTEL